ncbi:hypothetical protein KBT16_29065 [Nostoc sp. CCCryo 231-06]|nr:hypothetical protein [Nostoc sp. CCCryo 231-06]
MNKQLQSSIFEAISDGSQREWTSSEKELIANDSELQNHLKEWLNNSLSDTCWHLINYKIIQKLLADSSMSLDRNLLGKEIYIPF